jgi:tRNA pseudouridine13 synthase
MHIKQTPDDFRVEERIDIAPGGAGDYALYRLEKRGWTTPDALAALRRRWRIDAWRLAYGGLKDRHAHTVQYFSILKGPQRQFTQDAIHAAYLGQLSHPFHSEHIVANRFDITLRDASADAARLALAALDEVRRDGVPNYFDDQRFGSVADGGPFMARAMVLGDAEGALKLALTGAYRFDRHAQKQEKALLRQHWGDWPRLKELLPRCHARSLVDYLCTHPEDFRGAVSRLRPELRGLYLSAYQSHLWNRMLARCLQAHLPAEQLLQVPLRLGPVPMHRNLTEGQRVELGALQLPLHSPRAQFEENDPRKPFFDSVLADDGITQEQLRLKGFRDLFFSRGERRALCMPAELTAETAVDELHPGRQKLTLHFELPRGSYATLIVKRIQHAAKQSFYAE